MVYLSQGASWIWCKLIPGTDAVSPCDVCSFGENTQKVHPKTTSTSVGTALQQVHTDLMGPIHPTDKDGFGSVGKVPNFETRYQEVYLLNNKPDALASLQGQYPKGFGL